MTNKKDKIKTDYRLMVKKYFVI